MQNDLLPLDAQPNPWKVILSLCDLTGTWSQPYVDAGYDVRRVDLQAGVDVRLLCHQGPVHGILAAPPCTMFASSGARWERSEADMKEALAVVDACLRFVATCRPRWWALENPIGTLGRWLGEPLHYFNPSDYGDPYTKRTCLWGQFTIPPVTPVHPAEGSKMWSQYGGRSMRTKNARSATPDGFARAFFLANP